MDSFKFTSSTLYDEMLETTPYQACEFMIGTRDVADAYVE